MRRASILLLLIGCGGKAPAPKPPEPPAPQPEVQPTCDDAAAHLVEIDGRPNGVDATAVATDCKDRPWPQPVIACVSDAATLEGAQTCLADADPVCRAIAHVLELGADQFASVRGEEDEYTGELASKYTLPGATECTIAENDDLAATMTCELVTTTDVDQASSAYIAAASAVDACVGTKGWHRGEIENAVFWDDPDFAQPEITVFATTLDNGGTLQHTITIVFETRAPE